MGTQLLRPLSLFQHTDVVAILGIIKGNRSDVFIINQDMIFGHGVSNTGQDVRPIPKNNGSTVEAIQVANGRETYTCDWVPLWPGNDVHIIIQTGVEEEALVIEARFTSTMRRIAKRRGKVNSKRPVSGS